MADLSVSQSPAVRVLPAGGDARHRERRDGSPRRRGARREAVVDLLQQHGVEPETDFVPLIEVATDPATGEVRIRVWDERAGALLVDVPAHEFAAAAAANQTAAGLLVERAG